MLFRSQPGFTTVSLFVVGNDGVLLVDGQGSVDATKKMVDAIAKVTPKPIKWYVVGSDHGDHTAGNAAQQEIAKIFAAGGKK